MRTAIRPNSAAPRDLSLALCLLLIGFGAFFRVVRLEFFPDFQNFAPLMAIACCGALFLPGWLALAAPLGALFASDLILDAHYGQSFFDLEVMPRYVCFFLAVGSGLLARRFKNSPLPVLGVVAANSIFFYVFTDFFSWLGEAAYPKTVAGLLQALTVGLPGWPPAWLFLRNSLVSDLFFTALFLFVMHLATQPKRTEASLVRA